MTVLATKPDPILDGLNFLSKGDFYKLIENATRQSFVNGAPYHRNLYYELLKAHKELAHAIQGTNIDPFFNEKVIDEFLAALYPVRSVVDEYLTYGYDAYD